MPFLSVNTSATVWINVRFWSKADVHAAKVMSALPGSVFYAVEGTKHFTNLFVVLRWARLIARWLLRKRVVGGSNPSPSLKQHGRPLMPLATQPEH